MSPRHHESNPSPRTQESPVDAPIEIVQQVGHKSRWGYHACDYRTFLELKEYHRLMYRAYREHKRWLAWDRRTVRRTGPEPVQSPIVLFNLGGGGVLRPRQAYYDSLSAYQAARQPYATTAEVKSIPLGYWFDDLSTLRRHYATE